MKILNPDGSPVENPTIEQQIAALMAGHDTLSNAAAKSADDVAALMAGHDTLSNAAAKSADDVAALIVNVTAHGERLAKLENVPTLEKFVAANPPTTPKENAAVQPRRNTVNGREV